VTNDRHPDSLTFIEAGGGSGGRSSSALLPITDSSQTPHDFCFCATSERSTKPSTFCRLFCVSCIKPINKTASFEFVDERWITFLILQTVDRPCLRSSAFRRSTTRLAGSCFSLCTKAGTARSLNHFIGAGQQRRRNSEAEHFRCLEVHDQFEGFRCLNR
jgi:hypothetical protein